MKNKAHLIGMLSLATTAIALGTTAHARVPTDFIEVPQTVQYDGEYSPPAGRLVDESASPTRPIKPLMPWEKDIPVIVHKSALVIAQSQAAKMSEHKQSIDLTGNAGAESPTSQPAAGPGANSSPDIAQIIKNLQAQSAATTSAPVTTANPSLTAALSAMASPTPLPTTTMLNVPN